MTRFLALLPLMMLVVGCDSGSQPSMDTPVAITGKLTAADGKPFGNVIVHFQPTEAPAPASGTVAADGTFTVTTYDEKPGICKGKYVVYVRALLGKDASKTNPAHKTLPEKIRDEASVSPLAVEITSSGQVVELKLPK